MLHLLAFFAFVPGMRNRELIPLLPRLVAASASPAEHFSRYVRFNVCASPDGHKDLLATYKTHKGGYCRFCRLVDQDFGTGIPR
jgi:hypothetical protein